MSTSRFRIVEHTARCQHSRERAAGAELDRENELRLHIKQYIPESNPQPRPGDVTIIGAQANAFPKEMYEPLWSELCDRLRQRGTRVRAIWMADMASQGQSGILNESLLGPDSSWWDHGRDLLYFVNQFQDDIPHPIIGVGHSVGAAHLAHLSLLHPRLLHSLVMIDPILQRDPRLGLEMTKLSTTRRDTWPSRKDATEKMMHSKFCQGWDLRVFERWMKYGFRDLPTEQYPDPPTKTEAGERPVTLATTVAQEVYLYVQSMYPEPRLWQERPDNLLHEVHPENYEFNKPFGRPESYALSRRLPELKPSVLYICGSTSPASTPELRKEKLDTTGTAPGGSGGAVAEKVQMAVLETGHLGVAFEKLGECADAAADFIGKEIERWQKDDRGKRRVWESMTRLERIGINEAWRKNLGIESKNEGARKSVKL